MFSDVKGSVLEIRAIAYRPVTVEMRAYVGEGLKPPTRTGLIESICDRPGERMGS